MPKLDFLYFKNNTKRKIKKITLNQRFIAWEKDKEFYDGSRKNGYGGFKYDGRWLNILPKIIKKYNLTKNSTVLEIGCKKGFLLSDLKKLVPGIKCYGIEDHLYPIKNCKPDVRNDIKLAKYNKIPFSNKKFDCILAISSIYSYNFGDLIEIFSEMNRVSKNKNKIFITLASYESENDLKKFLQWSTLSTVILNFNDWKKFFKKVNYKGDYFFTTAKTLGIK